MSKYYVEFEKYKIEFNLDKDTLIIGENGVGKTRLLEFLNAISNDTLNPEKYNIVNSNLMEKKVKNNLIPNLERIFNANKEMLHIYRRIAKEAVFYEEQASVMFYNISIEFLSFCEPYLRKSYNKIDKLDISQISYLDIYDLSIYVFESVHYIKEFFKSKEQKISTRYDDENRVSRFIYEYKKYALSLCGYLIEVYYNHSKELAIFQNYIYRLEEIRKSLLDFRTKKEMKSNVKLNVNLNKEIKYIPVSRITNRYFKWFMNKEINNISEVNKLRDISLDLANTNYERIVNLKNKINNKIRYMNSILHKFNTGLELYFTNNTYLMRKDGKTVDIMQLSSGEKSLVVILCTIIFNENKLILIDEIDLSFTFYWQTNILYPLTELSSMNDNNFLITTHSALVYDTALSEKILEVEKFERI